ncbi:MAG: hypothetical protein CSB34_00390 [Desulfobulbus propionicus]|nr:MAG: hypothetical protein CSB34_00390 [Desulfobulbus propionicus]
MSSLMKKVNDLFHIITDWLLIILGIALLIIASRAIDVVVMRYGVSMVGILLSCTGAWFQFQRARGKKKS